MTYLIGWAVITLIYIVSVVLIRKECEKRVERCREIADMQISISTSSKKDALEALKREVERCERLTVELRVWKDIAHRETGYVETIKSEAIKEFSERLKAKFALCDAVYIKEIDNLVKEMVEGVKHNDKDESLACEKAE